MKPIRSHRPLAHRRRLGFTAIEVSAVATIIAILALILIPIMRNRVEAAKVVAAQDDMLSIEKAQSLVFADTGKYVRLQDLTRPAADPVIVNNPANPGYAAEIARVPQAQWNRELFDSEIPAMARTWTGVQISLHRSATVQSVRAGQPYLFSDGNASGGGPILLLDDDLPALGTDNIQYPLDPWGNPYIFQGPGRVTDPSVAAGQIRGLDPGIGVTETNFSTAVVYSLGPDGRPGNVANVANPLAYYRQLGAIGRPPDDLSREF